MIILLILGIISAAVSAFVLQTFNGLSLLAIGLIVAALIVGTKKKQIRW